MALDSKITVRVESTLTGTSDLSTVTDKLAWIKSIALANGTGANQADVLWHDQRTLTASSTEDLDLAGTLTNLLGSTFTAARIKCLMVSAAAANTNNVLVGGAASNQFINWVGDATDVVTVRPGGLLLLAAPDATAYVVTATTGDLLKIANSAGGTSVTYDIVLIGASA